MKSGKLDLDVDNPIRINKGRGTRVVYRGRYEEQPAIIKAYSGLPKAWLHWRTCLFHGHILRERGVAAPAILWSGWDKNLRAFLIVYEYLDQSRDFLWLRHTQDFATRWPGYKKLLSLFATMHTKGIEQSDTIPGNFLEQDGTVYAIDEDRMNVRSRRLSGKRSLRNIASMITEYPALTDQEIRRVYDHYCDERGWSQTHSGLNYLTGQIQTYRNWRRDKKAYRRRMIFRWGLGLVVVGALTATLMMLGS